MYSTYKTMMSILCSCVIFSSTVSICVLYVCMCYFLTSLHLNTLVSLTFIFRARKFNLTV